MFRYSGPLLSFVVIAVCLGINIARYPVVWEMVDQSVFAAKVAALEVEDGAISDSAIPDNAAPAVQSALQTAQLETAQVETLKEGTPVPPPLGGSPSSLSSSKVALFSTNLSKSPPDTVSSNGYGPIPAHSVPSQKIAAQFVPQAVPPAVEENSHSVAGGRPEVNKVEEEELSAYRPAQPQPVYANRYEERPSEPNEVPLAKSHEKPLEFRHELTPEERVAAFQKSPLDLTPGDDSDNEFSDSPEW